MDSSILISLGIFVVALSGLIAMRLLSDNRIEAKNTEIALALVPVVLFLLFTGRIDSLELGFVKIDSAFVEASQTPIAAQVTPMRGLPVTPVRANRKGAVDRIPRLIESKAEALQFRMGHGGYWGPAIHDYLVRLSEHPFLKFIVINKKDGTLWGIVKSHDLMMALDARAERGYDKFAGWLNEGNEEKLTKLPNAILVSQALTDGSDKREALTRMEDWNLDFLPVVDANKKFVGVVDRSRLTASLIIDVTQAMQGDSKS